MIQGRRPLCCLTNNRYSTTYARVLTMLAEIPFLRLTLYISDVDMEAWECQSHTTNSKYMCLYQLIDAYNVFSTDVPDRY